MQRVLSADLWKEIRATAHSARCRKAAIAYVTRDSIGLRKGDVLVLDASEHAIRTGETDAKLLRKLQNRGVSLYNCVDLHAKVLLLDEVAVVCSANMSDTSANRLVEAGVLTDHSSTVSAVASFLEQLKRQSTELKSAHIAALCKIKVIRRGGRNRGVQKKAKTKVSRLGNRTWLIGVKEIVRDASTQEQKLIERANKSLQVRLDTPDEDYNWIRWGTKGPFVRGCREGDSLIQIWRSNAAKRPSVVLRATPVLLRQKTQQWTRFYHAEMNGLYAELAWGKFKKLLKELGYSRRVTANMAQLLDPDIADAIGRKWKSAVRS